MKFGWEFQQNKWWEAFRVLLPVIEYAPFGYPSSKSTKISLSRTFNIACRNFNLLSEFEFAEISFF